MVYRVLIILLLFITTVVVHADSFGPVDKPHIVEQITIAQRPSDTLSKRKCDYSISSLT